MRWGLWAGSLHAFRVDIGYYSLRWWFCVVLAIVESTLKFARFYLESMCLPINKLDSK